MFDHNHISANRPFWKGQQNTSLKKRVTPWSRCHVIYWVGEYKSPFQMNISNISSVLLWSQSKGHIISSVTQRWLAYACFPLILQVNNFHEYHCHHCQVLVLISRFDGWYCQSMLVLDVYHFRAKWLIHFRWLPTLQEYGHFIFTKKVWEYRRKNMVIWCYDYITIFFYL